MAKLGSKRNAGRSQEAKQKAVSTARTLKSEDLDSLGASASNITKELRQKCLDIFASALKPSDDDMPILQEVKGHLYHRNFAEAFGRDEYLRVYASRWSPSRSLAYLQVFDDMSSDIKLLQPSNEINVDDHTFKVVCIGGGAGGELVALAGLLGEASKDALHDKTKFDITLLDIADWGQVVTALHSGITTAPELSKYASQAKKDMNIALVDSSKMAVEFKKMDVLASESIVIQELVAHADLITFMFTLNELYTASMSKTQHLLSNTLSSMSIDSHLLIVDSPGTYSTVSINGAEKRYPMQWLLDYTLLGDPRKREEKKSKWTKLTSNDSRWFRLSDGLDYPVDLEDMRYQIHLYKRLSDNGGCINHLDV